MTSKKGDLVITIDPTRTRGVTLRIVVEAKDRPMPLGRMSAELAEARANLRRPWRWLYSRRTPPRHR